MPQYFFSLPRLLAKIRGGSAQRTEANWLEANAVGALVHAIVYGFFARIALSHLPLWQQLALLLPLVIVVLVFWMIWFLIWALVIRTVRAAGMLRDLPLSRVQGVLVGLMTTTCACYLIAEGSWLRVLGYLWLIAVSLNLLAAVILAVSDADGPAVL
jgi:hypothetical protein